VKTICLNSGKDTPVCDSNRGCSSPASHSPPTYISHPALTTMNSGTGGHLTGISRFGIICVLREMGKYARAYASSASHRRSSMAGLLADNPSRD